MRNRYAAALSIPCFALFLAFVPINREAKAQVTLFNQTFGTTAANVAAVQTAYTPAVSSPENNKFDNVVAGGTSTFSVAAASNTLTHGHAAGATSYVVRTTDLAVSSNFVVFSFDISVNSVSVASSTSAINVMIGSGFANNSTVTGYAVLPIQVKSSTTMAIPSGGSNVSGTVHITIVCNKTGCTQTYYRPGTTTTETLASGKYDVLVGTSGAGPVVNDGTPTTGTQSLTDIKFVFANGGTSCTYNALIKNIKVEDYDFQVTSFSPSLPLTFCHSATAANQTFTVNYSSGLGFSGASANVFVQLSDASGSFASPTTVGSVAAVSPSSGSISVTIPSSTPDGTGYRLRVNTTNPTICSPILLSGALTIQTSSASGPTVSPNYTQTVVTGSTGNTLTATMNNWNSPQWGYSTTSGGTFIPISGETNSTYTIDANDFPGTGTYYVTMHSQDCSPTPVIDTTTEIMVYVVCTLGTNLVTKGDFEGMTAAQLNNPSTVFSSQYTYVVPSTQSPKPATTQGNSTLGPEGTYTIFTAPEDPHYYKFNWCGSAGYPWSYPTGSGCGGNVLMANGSTSGSLNVWSQTLSVTANTDYVFSFWAVPVSTLSPTLQFASFFNCFQVGQNVTPIGGSCNWQRFVFLWNSGSSTSLNLAIRNFSFDASGNDIVIDNIQFYQCTGGPYNFPQTYPFLWRGNTTDWFDPDNWGNCNIPTCSDNVTIPGGLTNYPNVTSGTMNAQNVDIQSGGQLTIASGVTFNVCGNFSNSGTMNFNANSTTAMVGSGSQSLTGTLNGTGTSNNFGNLTVNKSASSLQQLVDVTVQQDLTWQAGSGYAQNGYYLKVGRNISHQMPYTASSGTVELYGTVNGAYTLTGGTGNFYNLYVNKTGASFTLNNNVTATNDLEMLSGTFNANGMYVKVGRSILHQAALTAGTGTFEVNSSVAGNYTSNASASGAFYNFISNKASSAFTLNSDLTVSNDFTVLAGTFLHNGVNLLVGRNFNHQATYTHGSGTLQLYGGSNGAYTLSGGTGGFYNVYMNKTAAANTFTLNNSMTVANDLNLGTGILVAGDSATALLTVTNTATGSVHGHTVPTSNSYVRGYLRRYINAAGGSYDFPVGEATAGYQCANVNFTTATNIHNLRASFHTWSSVPASPLGTMGDCGAIYNQPALDNGRWRINAYNSSFTKISGTGTYTMTLYNRPGSYTNVGASVAFTVMKSSDLGATWALNGNCVAPGNNVNAVQRSGMSGFSDFGTDGSVNPFPVSFLELDATLENGNDAKIAWTARQDGNTAGYGVEHAYGTPDGFEQIGYQPAEPGETVISYKFADNGLAAGSHFYRVRSEDLNGQATFSNVVELLVGQGQGFSLRAFPNPAQGELNLALETDRAGEVTVGVFDAVGRQVLTRSTAVTAPGTHSWKLDVSQLAAGPYMIRVSQEGRTTNMRFVKR